MIFFHSSFIHSFEHQATRPNVPRGADATLMKQRLPTTKMNSVFSTKSANPVSTVNCYGQILHCACPIPTPIMSAASRGTIIAKTRVIVATDPSAIKTDFAKSAYWSNSWIRLESAVIVLLKRRNEKFGPVAINSRMMMERMIVPKVTSAKVTTSMLRAT